MLIQPGSRDAICETHPCIMDNHSESSGACEPISLRHNNSCDAVSSDWSYHAPSFLFMGLMGCLVRLYTSHDLRGVITETNHVEWKSYCGIVWYWNSFYCRI